MTNITSLVHEGFGCRLGRIRYKIYEPADSAFPCRSCIFTGMTRDATNSILASGMIVQAICRAECIVRSQVDFYDLQTQMGYRIPSGMYVLQNLEFDPDAEYTFVGKWVSVRCPEAVHREFGKYIGPFYSAEEFVRSEYPNLQREAFEKEVAWLKGWMAGLEKFEEDSLRNYHGRVLKPAEALAQGYHREIRSRKESPDAFHDLNPDMVVVDLKDSYLRGQLRDLPMTVPLSHVPHRFALWSK
jgi:hypothetical protein